MTMLIIRHEQMEALSKSTLEQFVLENTRRVGARFPEAVTDASEDAVLKWVLRTTERARAHGVTRRRDMEQFIDLEVIYGPEFELRHSEPGQILARKEIDGARKMALIEDWELFARPERSRR